MTTAPSLLSSASSSAGAYTMTSKAKRAAPVRPIAYSTLSPTWRDVPRRTPDTRTAIGARPLSGARCPRDPSQRTTVPVTRSSASSADPSTQSRRRPPWAGARPQSPWAWRPCTNRSASTGTPSPSAGAEDPGFVDVLSLTVVSSSLESLRRSRTTIVMISSGAFLGFFFFFFFFATGRRRLGLGLGRARAGG